MTRDFRRYLLSTGTWPAVVVALCGLLAPAHASAQTPAPEVRTLELTDGRLLTGRVLSANAEGMEVEIPQGRMSVPYTSLAEVEVLAEAEYAKQAPLRIAVAPVLVDESGQKVGRELDLWLTDLIALVPHTEVNSPKQWAQALAGRGTKLHSCGGEAACLRPLAADLGIDRIITARLGEDEFSEQGTTRTLQLRTLVVSSGASLRPAFTKLKTIEGRPVPGESSQELLDGVFLALGFEATVDTGAVAAAKFPPSTEEALTTRGGSTEDDREAKTAQAPTLETQAPTVSTIQTRAIQARPVAKKRAAAPSNLSLSPQQAVGLGFLPVPGLTWALRGEPRGFAVSLITTVGLSWAAVYTAGRLGRSPKEFWLPSVVVPYAICVGINQLSLALATRGGGRPRVGTIRPRKRATVAAIAPLLSPPSPQAASQPTGASLLLSGSF